MKPALVFFLSVFLLPVLPLHAAPLARDLGEGLAYHRAAVLPADLPTEESARKQPCVLDLRYAEGDAAAGTVLLAWLKFHAAVRTPVFLLINADTSPALLAPVAARAPFAGLIVIGSASPALTPDLELKIASVEERRAYGALAAGTPVELLLNDTPEKIRNDEARLAQDHHGSPDPTLTPADDLVETAPATEKPAPPKASAPLIDSALQRAVQLHRSLKALKKI